jgi:hypothetical protein
MPTEDELRQWFQAAGNEASGRRVDAATVIRRSKRRRLPGQIAAGGAVTLAVAGLSVGSIAGIRTLMPRSVTDASISSGDAGSRESGPLAPQPSDSATGRVAAEGLNLCGERVAVVPPAESGLVLTPHFPASAATGAPVAGTVTLTNTGTTPINGTTAVRPAMTLSQNGVTLWHSNGPMIMMARVVSLEPGQSMEYSASVTPVRCAAEDDLNGFRDDLPALGAGQYLVSAAIDVTLEKPGTDGSVAQLVTGPAQTLILE